MRFLITVSEIMLETTRRCNQSCKFCMRGPAQNLDMNPQYAAAALSAVDRVDTVTLTGGEPLLEPGLCSDLLLMSRAAGVINYFIATNGTVSPSAPGIPDLLEVCRQFPMNPDLRKRSIRVSQTEYHRKLQEDLRQEWNDIHEATIFVPNGTHRVLKRGNAAKNRLDADRYWLQPLDMNIASIDRHSGEITIAVNMLYVSADGRVFSDCNLSYCSMERLARLQPKTVNGEPIYLGKAQDLQQTLSREVERLVHVPVSVE